MHLLNMLLLCQDFKCALAPDPGEIPTCKHMVAQGLAIETPGQFYSVKLTPDGARYARAADMFGMLEVDDG